jgi:uncharacterized protein
VKGGLVVHGKICYIEIPAADVDVSAEFYAKIFGWKLRTRGDGERAFDDAAGAVSGTWVREHDARMITYIMVDSIDDAQREIVAAGGRVVSPYTPIGSSGAGFAIFLDPAGNRLGLYEQPQA